MPDTVSPVGAEGGSHPHRPAFSGAVSQVTRARNHEPGAFEQLYRDHSPALLAYCRALTARTSVDAEDIVAETFLLAWRRLGYGPNGVARIGTDSDGGFRVWLYRTAGRLIRHELRDWRLEMTPDVELGGQLVAVDDDPERIAFGSQAVAAALSVLSGNTRKIMVLRMLEYTDEQIAEALGLRVNGVRVAVSRARDKLRTSDAADLLSLGATRRTSSSRGTDPQADTSTVAA